MSFTWLDYLELAKRLAEAELDEASHRSAISRAYYAAFHTAMQHIKRTRPDVRIPAHGGKHEIVWDALEQGTRQEKAAHMSGDRLRRLRAKADYALIGLQLPTDMKRALELAKTVINSLHAIALET